MRLPHPIPLPARAEGRPTSRRGFERTQVWIFDLDNTLYPADCNLFAQVDSEMGEFIAAPARRAVRVCAAPAEDATTASSAPRSTA